MWAKCRRRRDEEKSGTRIAHASLIGIHGIEYAIGLQCATN